MDVTALLVFVSGFIVCAGAVFLFSIFGAKEETFEEALAKQRKANEKEKTKNKDKKKEADSGSKKSKNWRIKKKGGEKDDKQDVMDEVEEEPVVVVPTGAKVEDVVEAVPEKLEEVAPAPVESKPSKKEKKNKNKIDIQEVEVIPEAADVTDVAPPPAEKVVPEVQKAKETEVKEIVAPVENAKPVKSSPAKQKAKKEKAVAEFAAPNPKELLTIVKKTSFNDAEAQKLIDVLLTKQSGDALNTSDEWIEKGKPTEAQRLKQELSDTVRYLEEEKSKVKSFTDKLTSMRKELNDERAAKANYNRNIEEFQKARAQEVGAVNSRLQQVVAENTLLKNNLQNELAVRRSVEMNTSHFQATIDNLTSQLEMAKMAASQAKANDPHLLTELEQLRTLRDKYENTLAEININNSNLKNQINQQTDEISSIKNQLSSSSDKVSQLSSSNANLEKALAAKSEEIQNVTAELKNLKSKPQEPAILNNNNINVAAIEEELANVKKSLATKETEVVRLNGEITTLQEKVSNTVSETVNGHSEVDNEWRDKYQQLNLDHEKMLVKLKGLQSDLDSEVSSNKGQMESLKSKNNDLSKSLAEEKKTSVELLLRLFPSISNKGDLSALEADAKNSLEKLRNVEAQSSHYQTVLAQAEEMLSDLQTSVEKSEAEWREKLEIANKELTELRAEKSNSAQSSHINKQMQVQMSELQKKLTKEEEDKSNVSKLNEELRLTSKELDKEVERISLELSESKKKQNELMSQVKELQATNQSLNEIAKKTQESLEKEQAVIKCYQESPGGKMENGQSTPEALSDSKTLSINSIPPSVSTPSIASIDSTTNTSPEKKKKSKKKKTVQ